MGRLTVIKNRIYSDYFMPSRLQEYEEIIRTSKEKGYIHLTLREYYKLLKNNLIDKNEKYFVNRHDIDTDISTAKEFFKIEKKYKVNATYYFRLSTLDFKFMKEIEKYGGEASYHFEEIATYAKINHLKTKEEVFEKLDEIKEVFIKNFKQIENKGNIKLHTVCSHGDFANRKLGIFNHEITKDENIRKRLGIDCETYDADIMNSFDIYVSDRPYPKFYAPNSIFEYIGKKNIICMLSHPRHWKVNWTINSFDNIQRIYEGLKW